MKIVFMGSPEFAVPSLLALADKYEIVGVVTQPDRPKGRGRTLSSPPVKDAAVARGLGPIFQPEKLRCKSVREEIAALSADLFVVVAYGQILSKRMLNVPRLGCINVHGSLLPKYRGAAPIQWAVLNGEEKSGITIMKMDVGLDTGPMILSKELILNKSETAGSLHDRLASLGSNALIEAVTLIDAGQAEYLPQPEEGSSYARMLTKSDGAVDWEQSATNIDAWIRGMDPWPGAFCEFDQKRIKLFNSVVETKRNGNIGEILDIDTRGILVGTAENSIWIKELQLPGKKRTLAKDLALGRAIKKGDCLK